MEDAVTVGARPATLGEALVGGAALARHHTKLVGGVRWRRAEVARWIQAPRPVAQALVAVALGRYAERLWRWGAQGGSTCGWW